MAGSTRLLNKLNEAVRDHKYYEAHQLLKTLNFRYTSAKKYEELEILLKDHAMYLLDNKQFESGMDIAILLTNLYKLAVVSPTQQRIDVMVGLLKKMSNSPERGQYIHHLLEWLGSSELSNMVNSESSRIYIEERSYDEAWRHILRLYDGKQAGMFAMQVVQGLGTVVKREELGLITAHLVVSFLVAKKVSQAEAAFAVMVQSQDSHLPPLFNGVRFLIEAAKTNDPPAFQATQTLYDMSFSRDPSLRKLVAAAGKSLFHLSDERNSSRGGNGIMSLLSAFMNPEMSR